MIDFTTPCTPSIHEMPKPVRDAGKAIRAEIQRRHQRWMMDEGMRRNHERHAANQAAKYEARGRGYTPTPAAADASQRAYKDLDTAYHAWACTTCPPRPALNAHMTATLQAVYESMTDA